MCHDAGIRRLTVSTNGLKLQNEEYVKLLGSLHARIVLEQVPEALGAEAREGVLDLHGTAQLLHIRGGVGAFDSVPAVDPSGRHAPRMDIASVTVRAHAWSLSL